MMIMYFLIKVRNTGRWVQPVPQINYWSIHIKITPSLLTLFPDAPLVPIFNHRLRILFCCLLLPILIPNSLLVQISYHKLKFCSVAHISYRPLPIEGKAMLDKFSSSASIKQFLTVLSNNCIASFVLQVGPLQWITNLAGKLWPGHMAAI